MNIKNIKLYIVIIAVTFISGCANSNSKYGSTVDLYDINSNGDYSSSSYSSVTYKSYDYLLSEANKNSSINLWSDYDLKENIKNIPKGGIINIKINATTIGEANTKYWEYLVTDINDNVIKRVKGRDSVPDYYKGSTHGFYKWWNINIVSLNNTQSEPFKIHVINNIVNKRISYIINPNVSK